jgi:hypothetical protein
VPPNISLRPVLQAGHLWLTCLVSKLPLHARSNPWLIPIVPFGQQRANLSRRPPVDHSPNQENGRNNRYTHKFSEDVFRAKKNKGGGGGIEMLFPRIDYTPMVASIPQKRWRTEMTPNHLKSVDGLQFLPQDVARSVQSRVYRYSRSAWRFQPED